MPTPPPPLCARLPGAAPQSRSLQPHSSMQSDPLPLCHVPLQVRPEPYGNKSVFFAQFLDKGQFPFDKVQFVARYGTVYHLHFSLVPIKGVDLTVANATSNPIEPQACPTRPNARFFIPGDIECKRCVKGGTPPRLSLLQFSLLPLTSHLFVS